MKRSLFPGFTLVELMVAMAVTTLVFAMLFQLVANLTSATGHSSDRLENIAALRESLANLSHAWTTRVNRKEFPVEVGKQTGNDTVKFLARTRSFTGARRVTGNVFRVGPAGFEVGLGGTSWDDSPFSTYPQPSQADFALLSPEVFRIEIAMLDGDFQVLAAPPSTPEELAKIRGVIVTLASISNKARARLTDAELSALATLLPDAVDGLPPLQSWSAITASPTFADSVPKGVASDIECAQQFFLLRP